MTVIDHPCFRGGRMKKLTLDPEALCVQSVATVADAPAYAAGMTRPHVCDPVTAWC
jgi:hypothetical protein